MDNQRYHILEGHTQSRVAGGSWTEFPCLTGTTGRPNTLAPTNSSEKTKQSPQDWSEWLLSTSEKGSFSWSLFKLCGTGVCLWHPWLLPTVLKATSPCASVSSWSVPASPPAAHPPLSPHPGMVGNQEDFPYRVILSDRDTNGLSGLTVF